MDIGFLWLLLLIPIAIAWYIFKINKQSAELKISSTKGFMANKSRLPQLKHGLFILRLLALIFLITAIARPRTINISTKIHTTEGIDIIMTIDVSASMLARDLKSNRLEATKEVAPQFIEGRTGDRIGLVVYSGESYTRTPITSDKSIILEVLYNVGH